MVEEIPPSTDSDLTDLAIHRSEILEYWQRFRFPVDVGGCDASVSLDQERQEPTSLVASTRSVILRFFYQSFIFSSVLSLTFYSRRHLSFLRSLAYKPAFLAMRLKKVQKVVGRQIGIIELSDIFVYSLTGIPRHSY